MAEQRFAGLWDDAVLACCLEADHPGDHIDPDAQVYWRPFWPAEKTSPRSAVGEAAAAIATDSFLNRELQMTMSSPQTLELNR